MFTCTSSQVFWYFHLYEGCNFFTHSCTFFSSLFFHNQLLWCAASILDEGSPTSSPDIYVVFVRLKTTIKNLDSAWCRLTCHRWILQQYSMISTMRLLLTPTKVPKTKMYSLKKALKLCVSYFMNKNSNKIIKIKDNDH